MRGNEDREGNDRRAGRDGPPVTRTVSAMGTTTANHYTKQIDNDMQHLFALNQEKILTSFWSTATAWDA